MGVPAMVRMVAIFSSGVTAGILFGDRMGATFARPSFERLLRLRFGNKE